ncbi:MAG: hypothetical protein LBS36_09175 [Oscillospiraceae bacterium]|nr:hypothetical protein [Oscillospiraceae bacterium]
MPRMRRPANGYVYAAFGLGLFLGACFPTRYLVIFLAISVILAGISLCKNR